MKQYKHLRKPLTPERSLGKQLSWLPDKTESFPKSPNSSLTIGLISGERLYWSMQYEGKVVTLTEANWQWVLKYGELDLLLIESCAETATGDWFMAQTAPDLKESAFGEMVAAAREQDIPVAYWFTLDEEYLPLYQPMVEWMGGAFCADDRVVEALTQQAIPATLLPPAVQPALFTKLSEYTPEKRELKRVVCDDLVDVIQSWEGRESFYQDLQEFGAYFYDSRNQIWNIKTKKLELQAERLLGTVDLQSRAALFKQARTLALLKSGSRTRTDMQWSIVEAAASHMTVLLEPGVDVGEFASLCLQPSNRDQFFVELIRHDKDNLYYERVAQKAWREALMNHTYSHRLRTICQMLKLEHDWVEYPSAAMVTPSYRKEFLDRARESFVRQTYPNKQWVMVFNGPKAEFDEVKAEVHKIGNSQAIYIPSELHAGSCLNVGIQKATTEYVFSVKDDKYYGSSYLLDIMLCYRVLDVDMLFKVFSPLVAGREPSNTVCSQGGRKGLIANYPYSERSVGSVDVQWLDLLRTLKRNSIILFVNDFNMVVDHDATDDQERLHLNDPAPVEQQFVDPELKKVVSNAFSRDNADKQSHSGGYIDTKYWISDDQDNRDDYILRSPPLQLQGAGTPERLSIIIPIYNKVNYFAKTLASLEGLESLDVEFILVDDGSTDGTEIIIKDYCTKDERAKHIRQQNAGLSAARNTGLRHCTGEWIFFHDADDEIVADGLVKLFEVAKNSSANVVGGVLNRVLPDGSQSVINAFRRNEMIEDFRTDIQSAMRHSTNFSCCNKIFSRRMLQQIPAYFQEGLYMQDIEFWLHLLNSGISLKQTDLIVSNYNQIPGSGSRVQSTARFESVFRLYDLLRLHYSDRNGLPREVADTAFMQGAVHFFLRWKLTDLDNQNLRFQAKRDLEKLHKVLKDIPLESYRQLYNKKNNKGPIDFASFLARTGDFDAAATLLKTTSPRDFRAFSKANPDADISAIEDYARGIVEKSYEHVGM